MQRKSHVLNQALPEEQQRPDYRRPYVSTHSVSHLCLWLICCLDIQTLASRVWFVFHLSISAFGLFLMHPMFFTLPSNILLLQYPRIRLPDRLSACRHPRPSGCRLSPLERILRPPSPRRRLLSMDAPRNSSHRWRCCHDWLLWHRPRADSLSRRSPGSLQPPSFRGLLLRTRINSRRHPDHRASPYYSILSLHQPHSFSFVRLTSPNSRTTVTFALSPSQNRRLLF